METAALKTSKWFISSGEMTKPEKIFEKCITLAGIACAIYACIDYRGLLSPYSVTLPLAADSSAIISNHASGIFEMTLAALLFSLAHIFRFPRLSQFFAEKDKRRSASR